MSITLEITFTGLIAFAHDENNGKLYAIFPTTGFLGTSGVHQHHALLGFDRKHLPPESRFGEGASSHQSAHHAHMDNAGRHEPVELIPLGRMRLDFSGLNGSGSQVVPPDTAAPLRHFGAVPIDQDQIGNTPRESVHAQIVLPGADIMNPGKTARWRIGPSGNTKLYLSHELIWKREVPGTEVSFRMNYIGAATAPKTVRLNAEQGETIQIEVAHVPQLKDDHEVPKDQPATHFLAYHELFSTISNAQLPYLDQSPSTAQLQEHELSAHRIPRGPSVFTCMTAKVPVG